MQYLIIYTVVTVYIYIYVCMYNIQIIYLFDHIRVECSYCMHVREAM